MVERKLDEVIVILDRLGAETPEQRAERKAATPPMRPVDKAMVAVVSTVVGVVLLGAGAYIGAAKPDIWEHVPGVPAPSVPSPSGERAEPEESAR